MLANLITDVWQGSRAAGDSAHREGLGDSGAEAEGRYGRLPQDHPAEALADGRERRLYRDALVPLRSRRARCGDCRCRPDEPLACEVPAERAPMEVGNRGWRSRLRRALARLRPLLANGFFEQVVEHRPARVA